VKPFGNGGQQRFLHFLQLLLCEAAFYWTAGVKQIRVNRYLRKQLLDIGKAGFPLRIERRMMKFNYLDQLVLGRRRQTIPDVDEQALG